MTVHDKKFGFLGCAACLCLLLATSLGLARQEKRSVLSVLRRGLPVTIREVAGRYEVGIVEGLNEPLPHEIANVGHDYVVVADLLGLKRTLIPIWSLASITIVKINP